mmetsp:Transcript_46474/g.75850  ORF Transcript_46474/g.75850 Transcript_46474/m.75850 type:complete len:270 (-) Transcript_46474:483-1292(-)
MEPATARLGLAPEVVFLVVPIVLHLLSDGILPQTADMQSRQRPARNQQHMPPHSQSRRPMPQGPHHPHRLHRPAAHQPPLTPLQQASPIQHPRQIYPHPHPQTQTLTPSHIAQGRHPHRSSSHHHPLPHSRKLVCPLLPLHPLAFPLPPHLHLDCHLHPPLPLAFPLAHLPLVVSPPHPNPHHVCPPHPELHLASPLLPRPPLAFPPRPPPPPDLPLPPQPLHASQPPLAPHPVPPAQQPYPRKPHPIHVPLPVPQLKDAHPSLYRLTS